ncbi:MAG: DUF3310 domain-containing protein [Alloprevotella sp.]|nr:DUF3310 domain-containing protein [Alloprevotella sp.]
MGGGVDKPLDPALVEAMLETMKPKEAVNHPEHYAAGQYECIDVMVDIYGAADTQIFCVLNAFKYIWRCWRKNSTEDIQKAVWYLNKYLELEEKLDEVERG